MPLHIACCLLALLLVSGAGAQEPAPAPQPAPPAAAPAAPQPSKTPPQTTTVHGTVPDLAGRWLVLFDLAMGEQHRTIASVIEIGRKDGEVDVIEHFANLPGDMNAEIERLGGAGTYWQPTPAQLAAIDAEWTALADANRGVTSVANELWGKDGFDDAIKKEPDVKDAQWVLRQTYTFAPGGQRPVKQVNVFGALAPDGSGWKGNTVAAALAVAPFPIPITYKGTFRMIRLGEEPAPVGLLARLLAMFKGCGG